MNYEAQELELYADNTAALANGNQIKSIRENLKRKLKAGKYNHAQAPKLWRYYVDNAAKSYMKEFRMTRNPFSTAVRNEVAKRYADEFLNEVELRETETIPVVHYQLRDGKVKTKKEDAQAVFTKKGLNPWHYKVTQHLRAINQSLTIADGSAAGSLADAKKKMKQGVKEYSARSKAQRAVDLKAERAAKKAAKKAPHGRKVAARTKAREGVQKAHKITARAQQKLDDFDEAIKHAHREIEQLKIADKLLDRILPVHSGVGEDASNKRLAMMRAVLSSYTPDTALESHLDARQFNYLNSLRGRYRMPPITPIVVTRVPATNTRGTRFKAKGPKGSVTVSMDYAKSDTANRRAARDAYVRKFG